MTLVLPYGGDQISNNLLFSGSCNNRNSSMPCVFDGEALDFESALMTDWTSDIGDYDTPAEDSSIKTPSDASELKRKLSLGSGETLPSKKPRVCEDELVAPLQSGIVSSSSSSSDDRLSASPSISPPSSPTSFAQSPLDSSTSSSSSSSDGQDDDASQEIDDDDYIPRRRGPPMWNSRQRWKDERKKVLKMSMNKLGEIEDPELCLWRSVLINNTIKKLHMDIRNERQVKLRHRQQRMDYFAERFQPLSGSAMDVTQNFPSNFDASGDRCVDEIKSPAPQSSSVNTSSDLYDESSCDEIFGISEDFLRVTIPDRRVSSPIPTSQPREDNSRVSDMDTSESGNKEDQAMDAVVTSRSTTSPNVDCYTNSSSSSLPSCDTAVGCASPFYQRSTQTTPQTVVPMTTTTSIIAFPSSTSSNPSRRLAGAMISAASSGGSQCATQYRTNRDLGSGVNGDGTFPPRVPILDSVVYHSLLASLESS